MEDLLYVLVGVDGRYITAQPLTGRQSRTFLVDPNLDLSIRELVNRILPVAASYSTVTRLVLETSLLRHTWPRSVCQPASLLAQCEGPGDRCREPSRPEQTQNI